MALAEKEKVDRKRRRLLGAVLDRLEDKGYSLALPSITEELEDSAGMNDGHLGCQSPILDLVYQKKVRDVLIRQATVVREPDLLVTEDSKIRFETRWGSATFHDANEEITTVKDFMRGLGPKPVLYILRSVFNTVLGMNNV